MVAWWDRLDANRERKERYHEIGRSDVPLEWGMSQDEILIHAPIHHVYWKQILKGEFLDAIYNCPFEMHELVADADISKAVFALKDIQIELISACHSGIFLPARCGFPGTDGQKHS